jgi:hypothetical protein
VGFDGGKRGHSTMTDLRGLESLDKGVSCKHNLVMSCCELKLLIFAQSVKYYELNSSVSK